ncbi:hypothetical protein C3999_01800 [Escherichia marmotae]|nr:hypothetical protein C4A10_01841 [Escherichia marmotae]RDR63171.1 hypothetical protein C4A06_01973 [Escherichia marmotae]RDR81447.1 hypothetical protein C3999_01800 [Escherichia marmotae]RDR97650.1 hypothetical protein C3998_01819 [Escherichia marmotae]
MAGIKARTGNRQAARQGEIRFRQQNFLPGSYINRVAEQSHSGLGNAHPGNFATNKFCRAFCAKFRAHLCRLTRGSSQPPQHSGDHIQHIHNLTQPVRDFRADFQYRLRTAAEKDIGGAILNHRITFSMIIFSGGRLTVDVDVAGTLGNADFRRMVFAYHRTQYGARGRATVSSDIIRSGQNFSCCGMYRAPDGLPKLQDSGSDLISQKSQNKSGKKTTGSKSKAGGGNNGNANDGPYQKTGKGAGVVDRIIHPCGFIHDKTSLFFSF